MINLDCIKNLKIKSRISKRLKVYSRINPNKRMNTFFKTFIYIF